MRVGVRIGRGMWVYGGGGLFVWAMAIRLLSWTAALVIASFVVAAIGVVLLIAALLACSPGARRSLFLRSISGSVEPGVIQKHERLCDPRVWGAYFVGSKVFTGPHPKRELDLRQMYPRVDDAISCVALMPNAAYANAAARQLRQHGFSVAEVRRLFPASGPIDDRPISAYPADVPQDLSHGDDETTKPQGGRMKQARDYTKYRFDGPELGKGRLVLALVTRYVADHPQTTFAALRQAFPDALQAASSIQFSNAQTVVARMQDLSDTEVPRFFVGRGETIQLVDGEVAVSREWNRINIQNVLQHAWKIGYRSEAI